MRTTNCPVCGASLTFQEQSGKVKCAACGNTFDEKALETLTAAENREEISFASEAKTFDAGESGMQAYHCKNCGAALMTEDTATTVECPYCGSPTVLPDHPAGGVKPEWIVPFQVTREQAQQIFDDYFKGKRLLPNVFLEGRSHNAEMRKLYVPYWLFSCEAEADFAYDAQKKRIERHGEWELTHTGHYAVRRRGYMRFEDIPVDGSVKLADEITESIEPYDLSEAVPFEPDLLAGAMTDFADADQTKCEKRAVERVENSVSNAMRATVEGYDTVTTRGQFIRTVNGTAIAALMPVWLMTTVRENHTYTFAINGQTGKLTCDVPTDKKKAVLWGDGIFAALLALAAIVLELIGAMGSGTLLLGGIFALLVTLGVVGAMKAKLRQAVRQSAAENYLVEDSFELDLCYDDFLYADTKKRRIEPRDKPKA